MKLFLFFLLCFIKINAQNLSCNEPDKNLFFSVSKRIKGNKKKVNRDREMLMEDLVSQISTIVDFHILHKETNSQNNFSNYYKNETTIKNPFKFMSEVNEQICGDVVTFFISKEKVSNVASKQLELNLDLDHLEFDNLLNPFNYNKKEDDYQPLSQERIKLEKKENEYQSLLHLITDQQKRNQLHSQLLLFKKRLIQLKAKEAKINSKKISYDFSNNANKRVYQRKNSTHRKQTKIDNPHKFKKEKSPNNRVKNSDNYRKALTLQLKWGVNFMEDFIHINDDYRIAQFIQAELVFSDVVYDKLSFPIGVGVKTIFNSSDPEKWESENQLMKEDFGYGYIKGGISFKNNELYIISGTTLSRVDGYYDNLPDIEDFSSDFEDPHIIVKGYGIAISLGNRGSIFFQHEIMSTDYFNSSEVKVNKINNNFSVGLNLNLN